MAKVLAFHRETDLDQEDLLSSLNETLKRLGEERIQLEHKQKELDDEFEILGKQINSVHNTIYRLNRESHLNDAVTPFVATIEIADQYFDLKNHVKQNYNFKNMLAYQIYETLLKDLQQLMLKFNKIDIPEIHTLSKGLVLGNGSQKEEDRMLRNPIYRLVFHTREEGYVMDPNPIVELEKLMISDPSFYDVFFIYKKRPMDCKENLTPEEVHNKYSEFRSKTVKAVRCAETAVEKAEGVVDL